MRKEKNILKKFDDNNINTDNNLILSFQSTILVNGKQYEDSLEYINDNICGNINNNIDFEEYQNIFEVNFDAECEFKFIQICLF